MIPLSNFTALVTQTVLEHGGSFAGVNRKVQLKPLRWAAPEEGSSEPPRIVEALLILKHGGVLTHAGRQQVLSLTRSHLAQSKQDGPILTPSLGVFTHAFFNPQWEVLHTLAIALMMH